MDTNTSLGPDFKEKISEVEKKETVPPLKKRSGFFRLFKSSKVENESKTISCEKRVLRKEEKPLENDEKIFSLLKVPKKRKERALERGIELKASTSFQTSLSLIREIGPENRLRAILKSQIENPRTFFEGQASLFTEELAVAVQQNNFDKILSLLKAWEEFSAFFSQLEKPVTLREKIRAIFQRVHKNIPFQQVGGNVRKVYPPIGECLGSLSLGESQGSQLVEIFQKMGKLSSAYGGQELVVKALKEWSFRVGKENSEALKVLFFALGQELENEVLLSVYRSLRGVGVSNQEMSASLGKTYQRLCIYAFDECLNKTNLEDDYVALIQDILEIAIGNKALNAELHRKTERSKAEEALYEISYRTEVPEKDHQPGLYFLRDIREEIGNIKNELDICEELFQAVPFTNKERAEIGSILGSFAPMLVKYNNILLKLDGFQKSREALVLCEKFNSFREQIEKVKNLEAQVSQADYKGKFSAALMKDVVRLISFQEVFKGEVIRGDKEHPRLAGLLSDISEAQQLADEINEVTSQMSRESSGDIFLEDFKANNLLRRGFEKEESFFTSLRKHGLFGLCNRVTGRFFHAGIIHEKDGKNYCFGLNDSNQKFDFIETLSTVRYHPCFLKLLSQKGKEACRKIPGWENFSDEELEAVLANKYAEIMQKMLTQNEEKCEKIKFDVARGAVSVILTKIESLPKPLQMKLERIFLGIFSWIEGKTGSKSIDLLKNVDEKNKLFCSEYVVLIMREVFKEFHETLEKSMPVVEPIEMQEFLPPNIEARAIYPGRLEKLLRNRFVQIEEPLWKRVLFGSQL